ncbi:hypothetical protein N0V93_002912 [Gnomoniopsis smithogilvyi]|uniref:Uncharacterized protein n=1 Tax=Gnomoniopsis smithogilvyi TaxID=1191159 RepID=A0A9W8YZH5_9PEZI|nr:hypothetical protein N0V93_002912 [Gnomoniopsis smithogilvyi]
MTVIDAIEMKTTPMEVPKKLSPAMIQAPKIEDEEPEPEKPMSMVGLRGGVDGGDICCGLCAEEGKKAGRPMLM